MNTAIVTKFTNALAAECVVNTALEAESALKTAEKLNNLTSGLIAFVLNQVHSKNLYKEYGVKSTSAFAEKVLGISKSTASEYVKIGKYLTTPGTTCFKNEMGDFSPSVLVECMRQKLTDEEIDALPRNITVKEVRKKKKVIESDGTELEKENSVEIDSTNTESEKEVAKESDIYKLTLYALDGCYHVLDSKELTRVDIVNTKTLLEKDGYNAMAIYGKKIILMAMKPEQNSVKTIYMEYTRV